MEEPENARLKRDILLEYNEFLVDPETWSLLEKHDKKGSSDLHHINEVLRNPQPTPVIYLNKIRKVFDVYKNEVNSYRKNEIKKDLFEQNPTQIENIDLTLEIEAEEIRYRKPRPYHYSQHKSLSATRESFRSPNTSTKLKHHEQRVSPWQHQRNFSPDSGNSSASSSLQNRQNVAPIFDSNQGFNRESPKNIPIHLNRQVVPSPVIANKFNAPPQNRSPQMPQQNRQNVAPTFDPKQNFNRDTNIPIHLNRQVVPSPVIANKFNAPPQNRSNQITQQNVAPMFNPKRPPPALTYQEHKKQKLEMDVNRKGPSRWDSTCSSKISNSIPQSNKQNVPSSGGRVPQKPIEQKITLVNQIQKQNVPTSGVSETQEPIEQRKTTLFPQSPKALATKENLQKPTTKLPFDSLIPPPPCYVQSSIEEDITNNTLISSIDCALEAMFAEDHQKDVPGTSSDNVKNTSNEKSIQPTERQDQQVNLPSTSKEQPKSDQIKDKEIPIKIKTEIKEEVDSDDSDTIVGEDFCEKGSNYGDSSDSNHSDMFVADFIPLDCNDNPIDPPSDANLTIAKSEEILIKKEEVVLKQEYDDDGDASTEPESKHSEGINNKISRPESEDEEFEEVDIIALTVNEINNEIEFLAEIGRVKPKLFEKKSLPEVPSNSTKINEWLQTIGRNTNDSPPPSPCFDYPEDTNEDMNWEMPPNDYDDEDIKITNYEPNF